MNQEKKHKHMTLERCLIGCIEFAIADAWKPLPDCFVPFYAAATHNLSQGANAYPLPRIGDVKRYLIGQRPYFIADFLIRSIIRTRWFNEYPQQFNDYSAV